MNIEAVRSTENDTGYRTGHSLETVKGICGIPARLSGFVSWCIQLFILIISAILTALLFVHIGGYAYFVTIQNNSTTDVVDLISADLNGTYIPTETLLLNETDDETISTVRLLNGNETDQKIHHGPFEQIEDIHLTFWKSFAIDYLPFLRTLNILFLIFCLIWLITLGGLLLSLKLELTDLFCPNILLLMISIITMLVEAIAIAILLFYQKEYNWPILLVISGTVGGLLFCFIMGIFAFILLIVWYKYVNYVNNRKDACICLSSITDFVKRRRHPTRNQEQAAADYTVPEATNHSHLPYIDDPPVQQFSNF